MEIMTAPSVDRTRRDRDERARSGDDRFDDSADQSGREDD